VRITVGIDITITEHRKPTFYGKMSMYGMLDGDLLDSPVGDTSIALDRAVAPVAHLPSGA